MTFPLVIFLSEWSLMHFVPYKMTTDFAICIDILDFYLIGKGI